MVITLGEALAGRWTTVRIIILIGMLMGYFIVTAEPAVHVLNKQVYELTSGVIPKRAMRLSLAIGVSVSVGLSMLRILTGLPILYLLVPGYLLALVLSFFVPPVFTAIAFDSGGVASGPMTATFLLPFAMGECTAVGGNVITDAFGVVAMVAMTPLLTIQVLGLYFRFKSRRLEQTADEPVVQPPPQKNETEKLSSSDKERVRTLKLLIAIIKREFEDAYIEFFQKNDMHFLFGSLCSI